MRWEVRRCGWAGTHELLRQYHDDEWGTPSRDEQHLFEMLSLEGAQAGLSWLTILKKREGYRRIFASFDPGKVAGFGPAHIERILRDAAIVRNRMKVESVVQNAGAVLHLRREFGSFGEFIWGLTGGRPRVNRWRSWKEIPAWTEESRVMSRELKRRGFRFVGPTVCYSFMQAVGMVNDHETNCYRHRELARTEKQ